MKKRKRHNIASTIFALLFLVGLGIMLYPTVCNWYNVWQAKQMIRGYKAQVIEATGPDYSAQWAEAEAYNRRLAEIGNAAIHGIGEKQEYENLLDSNGTGMMGYIDIPAINVNLPVYHGIEEKALQSGAGHWEGTSLPTGGESTHCVITAHTGLVRAKMFTDLDQLKEGDMFSLSVLDRVLTYEVDQILITEPTDTSALKIEKGKDYVTLYTCYPYGVNTHRLLVRGHRIETPQEETQDESTVQVLSFWQRIPKPLLIALAILSVLLLLFISRKIQKRRKQSSVPQTYEQISDNTDKKEVNQS